MKKRTLHCFIIIFLAYGFQTYVCAQNNSILALAEKYALALKQTQSKQARKSIEPLFNKGNAVAKKLDALESLSETDYSLLEKKMNGFLINREEIVYIEPDTKFFIKFAKEHGTIADVAFFSLLHEIKPDGVWAAYIEQQTDVTGCTIYGNGLLSKLYAKALQFKKTYPQAYVRDIDNEIGSILAEFSDKPCACGDRNSVIKEFRLFIKTFPKDKNIPVIRKRLATILKDKNLRINCQSN